LIDSTKNESGIEIFSSVNEAVAENEDFILINPFVFVWKSGMTMKIWIYSLKISKQSHKNTNNVDKRLKKL